ncbi:histidine kinase [Halopiger goleimassiliensis]|uniref:histidine kinase n=1 Tax=Halopiger goleimassiliensis TaxID=1293048 RepID=UPI000677EDC7|nr:histidine kinase [Halopiger goleimassiliensis]
MLLRAVVDEVGRTSQTIAVVGDGPEQLEMMLDDAVGDGTTVASVETLEPASFDGLSDDDARTLEGAGATAVLLEEGDPVAASAMADLYDSILAINSDAFVTGSRGLSEIDLPDVLAGLAGTRLSLRGYPLAHKEKLLLILVSRYVERLAWEAGSGTLLAGFQRLSRIEDEIGTKEVYDRLERTDVDCHCYGVGDATDLGLEATIHAGVGPAYRDPWFVVFDPDEAADRAGALVCVERESRIWDGFFTFDPDCVERVRDAIDRAY